MKNLKHIKNFNESTKFRNKINESDEFDDESDESDIKVKDLISYLQKFDPETPVVLDRDGWQGDSVEDKIRALIDNSPILGEWGNYLIINN